MPEGDFLSLQDTGGLVSDGDRHSPYQPVSDTLPTPANDAVEENTTCESAVTHPTNLQRGYPAPTSLCTSVDPYHATPSSSRPAQVASQYEGDDLDMLWGNLDLDMASTSGATHFALPFPQLTADCFQDFFDFPLDFQGGVDSFADGTTQDASSSDPAVSSGQGTLSRYGSRLPSVQPENQYGQAGGIAPATSQREARNDRSSGASANPDCPWRLGRWQYDQAISRILERSTVLPADYTLPSRHALSRYVEGYFTGFHEHLPFLHVPTISIASSQPELVLALAATGALYRFERDRSEHLYILATLLVEDRLRRYDPSSFRATTRSKDPARPSACDERTHDRTSALQHDTHPTNLGSSEVAGQYQQAPMLQTMQAMLLLIALGTWNERPLLKDAFAMASQLAVLVREFGRSDQRPSQDETSWENWIAGESVRRTTFVAYCFFGLHSIAYNVPPTILSSELKSLILPCHEDRWRARNEQQWILSRPKDGADKLSLHFACSGLFAPVPRSSVSLGLSSFANYILAHAILQQLFFSRQSLTDFEQNATGSLPDETLQKFERALRRWQYNWESTKDSSIDPSSPDGPLAFNATALLRIAYIRLHANLGPCRQLDTGDPEAIAKAMNIVAPMSRSPQLYRAVLQTVHTLSIPVRVGVRFVANTRTLTWSVVHSLCNLECAMFLSQWLNYRGEQTAAGVPIDENEQRLMNLVQSLLDEAFVGDAVRQELDPSRRCRKMAAAVVRLWSDTFQSTHVFGLFAAIGQGLLLYAEKLNRQLGLAT